MENIAQRLPVGAVEDGGQRTHRAREEGSQERAYRYGGTRQAGRRQVGKRIDARLRGFAGEAGIQPVDVQGQRRLRDLGALRQRLLHRFLQRRDGNAHIERRLRNQRRSPHEVVAIGQHQRFQIVLRRGQGLLRGKQALLKIGSLGLRRHHVDRRQDSLLGLPPVTVILALRQFYPLGLHVDIIPGVIEFPVCLHGLRDYFDDALAQGLRAELLVLARHLQAIAVFVVTQPAPQRLGNVERERGGILRIERVERAVRGLAIAIEIERIASANRSDATYSGADVQIRSAELAAGRAAEQRCHRPDRVCAIRVHAEDRIVIALRAANLVARLLQLNARDRQIRIVGQHALDDFRQTQRGLCDDADARLDLDLLQRLYLQRSLPEEGTHEGGGDRRGLLEAPSEPTREPAKEARDASGGEGIAQVFE